MGTRSVAFFWTGLCSTGHTHDTHTLSRKRVWSAELGIPPIAGWLPLMWYTHNFLSTPSHFLGAWLAHSVLGSRPSPPLR